MKLAEQDITIELDESEIADFFAMSTESLSVGAVDFGMHYDQPGSLFDLDHGELAMDGGPTAGQ